MSKMQKLSKEEWRDLILSVGTHKEMRRLTPIEVAKYMKRELEAGTSIHDLANRVLLKGTTTIHKFLRLLKLKEDIQHLVDWGQSDVKIPWSTAKYLITLQEHEQYHLINKTLENSLNRKEVEQVIQLRKRSKKPIEECVQQIIDLRPVIERRYVFVGTVSGETILQNLDQLHQIERDELMSEFITEHQLTGNGRLGIHRFTLVGDETFSKQLKTLKPDFETKFLNWLRNKVSQ